MKTRTLFIAVVAAVLYGCGGPGAQPADQAVRPVKVYKTESLGSVNKDFAGMSTADNVSNLAFREPGQIVKLNVLEGRSVKKGTVIAEINPREYVLQMEADKATFLTAQSQVERNKRLLDKQAISRQDYEMAEASYVRARSAYDNSRNVLSDTRLIAPFSGAVEKLYVDNYQRVQAGEAVIRLVDPKTTTVKFTMPESGIRTLKFNGITFSVQFDNLPGVTFPARLKEYVQTATQAGGITVALTLEGPDLEKYNVAPGMSCSVNLRVDNPDQHNITAVPLTAVFSRDGHDYVWGVDAESRTVRHEVTLGELFGSDMVAVTSGLDPDQTVVTAGVYRITEGEQVKILK